MTSTPYLLGIDPGWVNLGYALLQQEYVTTGVPRFSLIKSNTLSPKDAPEVFSGMFVDSLGVQPKSAAIERYVPYNNTFSAEAENITMLIGSLRQALLPSLPEGTLPMLVRAIDWKTSLVKILVKHMGFDNPSTSLDKVFSVAAAKHILQTPNLKRTDHECDAICLAAYPVLLQRYAAKAPGR